MILNNLNTISLDLSILQSVINFINMNNISLILYSCAAISLIGIINYSTSIYVRYVLIGVGTGWLFLKNSIYGYSKYQ